MKFPFLSRAWAWLKARAEERSTWLGLGAAGSTGLASVGQYLGPVETHMIAAAVIAAGGVAAIMPSGGGAPENPSPAGPSDGAPGSIDCN